MSQALSSSPIASAAAASGYNPVTTDQFIKRGPFTVRVGKNDASLTILCSALMYKTPATDPNIIHIKDPGITGDGHGITQSVKDILTALLADYDYNSNFTFQASNIQRLITLTARAEAYIIATQVGSQTVYTKISSEYILLCKSALALVTELQIADKYTTAEKRHHLQQCIDLCTGQLDPANPLFMKEIDILINKIAHGEVFIIKESEKNSSYNVWVNDKTVAILTLPEAETSFSLGAEIPELNSEAAPGWQLGMAAREVASLLGFNIIPPGLAVEIEMKNGMKHRGFMHVPVPNGLSMYDCLNMKGGAELLNTLPKFKAHIVALACIAIAPWAGTGHSKNIVFEKPERTLEGAYFIDCNDTFAYNRVEPGTEINCVRELRSRVTALNSAVKTLKDAEQDIPKHITDELNVAQTRIDTAEKSIITIQIAILGLPQNRLPLDKATLINLTNPTILPLLWKYIRRVVGVYQISQKAFEELRDRVKLMQRMCQMEMDKANPQLTPPDIYHAVCGGEHLYDIGLAAGHARATMYDLFIGNSTNAIPDPSNLINIPRGPLRSTLTDPRSRTVLDNLRKLDDEIIKGQTEGKGKEK